MSEATISALLPYARVLAGVVGWRSDIARALFQIVEAADGVEAAERSISELVAAIDAKAPTRLRPDGLEVLKYCGLRLRWAGCWTAETEHTLFEMVATVHGTQVAREFIRSLGPGTTGPILRPGARPREGARDARGRPARARAQGAGSDP